MYARYRTRSRFYIRPAKVERAYGVSPDVLRRPRIKKHGLLRGIYADETVDLREKEKLELLEEIRHPRERDFYQDHTYQNQWIDRDLDSHQKMQLASRYKYFDPTYAVKPWLWYPGDEVEVVQGSEAVGQRGIILAVVPYKNEIIVQHINVQDIVIPATDTRPEQVVQREHPIHIDRVKHVDPSTGQTCTLAMVKVFKKGTRELEDRRISLDSGVLLPIPEKPEEKTLETGDPLRDTPLQDAEEETFDAAAEIPLLMDRKLQAMEQHFTDKVLQSSYEFHQPLRRANAESMKRFQMDVVEAATERLSERLARQFLQSFAASTGAAAETASSEVANRLRLFRQRESEASEAGATNEAAALSSSSMRWWESMLVPYMEELETRAEEQQEAAVQEAVRAEERRRQQASVDSMVRREPEEAEEMESFDDDAASGEEETRRETLSEEPGELEEELPPQQPQQQEPEKDK